MKLPRVASPQKIIIIGATSGIGREMASIYLAAGCKVGITGRRLHLLQSLAEAYPQTAFVRSFDVMEPGNLQHLASLIQQLGGLDLLIYNSGYGDVSEALDPHIEQTTTRTNVNGFLDIVSYTFNFFAGQGFGQIAAISSIAAIRGNSWAPAYSASKSFMSNYAEGLNIKAAKMNKNIIVTDVQPGFIKTKTSKGNTQFWVASPQKAALQIISGINKRKRRIYVTRRWWIIAQTVEANALQPV